MPSLSLTWHTMLDNHVCLICQQLEGYTWDITVGAGFPDALEHPTYGVVWDARGSRSHSHLYHTSGCRCYLSLDADIKDLLEIGKAKLGAIKTGQQRGEAANIEVTP